MRSLSLSGPFISYAWWSRIKGWLFYTYAIISCDQPLFTLWFLGLGDFTRILLSLSPLSYLSFYLSFPPSLSLLSIILFGVSNGCFRPCFYIMLRENYSLNYTYDITILFPSKVKFFKGKSSLLSNTLTKADAFLEMFWYMFLFTRSRQLLKAYYTA